MLKNVNWLLSESSACDVMEGFELSAVLDSNGSSCLPMCQFHRLDR